MERADFAAWCAAVCRHIRYRPARAQAAAELMDHLTDHAAALEDAGTAPEEAARTALAAMGDAGEVGGPWTGPIRPAVRLRSPHQGLRGPAVRGSLPVPASAPVPERLGSADLPAGE
ncbi:MAG: permease prefix domain 1-containing protein [Intestinimonas butyriciproducens]